MSQLPKSRLPWALAVSLMLGLFHPGGASSQVPASVWDFTLPTLELEDVALAADSLEGAWQQLATRFLVRTVLVTSDSVTRRGGFFFRAERCRVRDVLDALVAAYPGLAWTRDGESGVTWLHPADQPLRQVLAEEVEVAGDSCALPMQSGVLEPLAEAPGLGVVVRRWGAGFANTFDYAVDVPEGRYSVRRLLNLVTVQNPTKSFFVASGAGSIRITAVNLVTDRLRTPPAGALHWWRLHFLDEDAPGDEELASALASEDPARRAAARAYLEAVSWLVDFDGLVDRPRPAAQSVWTVLGVTSVLVRRPEAATHRASVRRLETLTSGRLAEDAPGLALLATLELARLSGGSARLEAPEPAQMAGGELSAIVHDLLRIASGSARVRGFLASHGEAISRDLDAVEGLQGRCLHAYLTGQGGEGSLRFQ